MEIGNWKHKISVRGTNSNTFTRLEFQTLCAAKFKTNMHEIYFKNDMNEWTGSIVGSINLIIVHFSYNTGPHPIIL